MKYTEIAFTCYPVTAMARSRQFYENTLGLKPTLVMDTPEFKFTEYDIASGTLAIGQAPVMPKPTPEGVSIALEVDDFENSIKELKSKNAKFTLDPLETPGCHMAIIADPDGSCILIHKRKAR